MINRNNKKGFTIVELVIVIAVIAILAAVLIPTFAGIIKKANESADTQVAKNMNTALAAYTAEKGSPETFQEVLTAIEEAGYVIANLNAKANGNLYAWDKVNNQIVYLDSELNAIYQQKEFNSADLCFVVADSSVTIPEGATSIALASDPDYLKNSFVTGGEIYVADNVAIKDDSEAGKNIITNDAVINFGDSVVKLDLPNATSATANYNALRINSGTVVLEGTNGGLATADNTELYALTVGAGTADYHSGATVTIKGGKYIAGTTAVNVVKGTVIIEGGHFENTPSAVSRYLLNCNDNTYAKGEAKIIVKGGTFVNFNPANNEAEGAGTNFVAEGYTVKTETQANGDVWYIVVKA